MYVRSKFSKVRSSHDLCVHILAQLRLRGNIGQDYESGINFFTISNCDFSSSFHALPTPAETLSVPMILNSRRPRGVHPP